MDRGDFLVSHAAVDRERADWIAAELENAGHRVLRPAGRPWLEWAITARRSHR